MKTLIKNATVINDGNKFIGSVLIDGNKIERVYSLDKAPDLKELKVVIIDATGLLLIPGVIDDQVHFREPGLTHKGEVATESRAAVAGGITTYMEMPNTNPQTTTQDALQKKIR
jgi:dihydroorotase